MLFPDLFCLFTLCFHLSAIPISAAETAEANVPAVSKENIYIQSVKLNEKSYDKSYITHEQIMNGSIFEFEMGNKPGKVWYEIEW